MQAEKLRNTDSKAAAALGPAGPVSDRAREPAGQGSRGRPDGKREGDQGARAAQRFVVCPNPE